MSVLRSKEEQKTYFSLSRKTANTTLSQKDKKSSAIDVIAAGSSNIARVMID